MVWAEGLSKDWMKMWRCWLNIFKEDGIKVFLQLINESVHIDRELRPPGALDMTFAKSGIVLKATPRRKTIEMKMVL